MQLSQFGFLIFVTIILQGCAGSATDVGLHGRKNTPQIIMPELITEPFGLRPKMINAKDIFTLNDIQKDDFLAYYNDPERAGIKYHQRLYDYLDSRLSGFTYNGDTLTAKRALLEGQGNCLSLAIVTTALADLVDLEIEYQKVNSIPVYKKNNDILMLAAHVRTLVYDPTFTANENEIVLVRPRIIIDYFPSRADYFSGIVDKQDFISMYYQNIAANYMAKQNYPAAFWLVIEALKYSTYNPESINMLAVIYRKIGMQELAEEFYKFGIEQTKGSLNLYSNYQTLLVIQGRGDEAAKLDKLLDGYDDDNPYTWLDLGRKAYNQQNYNRSMHYFEKAIQMAPYLDEGHFELARTLYARHKPKAATLSLQNAIAVAFEKQDRDLYNAKLKALKIEYQ